MCIMHADHVHKVYLDGLKIMRAEEEKRWKSILTQLNAHIRYRRRMEREEKEK